MKSSKCESQNETRARDETGGLCLTRHKRCSLAVPTRPFFRCASTAAAAVPPRTATLRSGRVDDAQDAVNLSRVGTTTCAVERFHVPPSPQRFRSRAKARVSALSRGHRWRRGSAGRLPPECPSRPTPLFPPAPQNARHLRWRADSVARMHCAVAEHAASPHALTPRRPCLTPSR